MQSDRARFHCGGGRAGHSALVCPKTAPERRDGASGARGDHLRARSNRAATRSPAILCRLFGLTRSEARLAAALASGRSLEDVALEFEISMNTVRTQLKAAMAKTETTRQGELIGLVLRSVG